MSDSATSLSQIPVCGCRPLATSAETLMMMACSSRLERQVVALLWQQMQPLLVASAAATDATVRALNDVLPDPATISSQELPELAKLHVSSSGNLMATLKMLAPEAFAADPLHPDLSALDDMEPSLLAMASTLIELQLFHLKRAATLTAHSRHRLAVARAAGQCDASGPLSSRLSSGQSASFCTVMNLSELSQTD